MRSHSLRIQTAVLAAVILLAASCSISGPAPEAPQPQVAEEIPDPFIKGRITVQFDEQTAGLVEKSLGDGQLLATKAPQLGGALDAIGIKSLRRVFPDAGEYEPRTRKEGLHRFYYAEFDQDVPATKAASGLTDIPGIVSSTPELPIRVRTFNDPYFSSQWHLYNTRYKGSDINVQKVWDEFTVGKSSVIVSVVDEGVFMEHEDLAGNLIPCLEDGSGSFNFNNGTPKVVPTQGHGTHVAGVISAVSNNGIGVAGVAGGDAQAGIPGVKVMSCQIFDLFGNQPDIYQAMKHGADHGAVILQCSWGFSPDLNGDGFTSDSEIELYRSFTIDDLPEYKAAIDYFIKYAGCDNNGNQLPDSPMKGGVVVFASGNDNFDFDPLVSYEPVIAVGAFGATGNKASYSNWGDWVDVAAPGGDAKQGIYSTLLSNNYGGSDWQGTSMACPHVSGVAALLVSYFGGPGFTAQECRDRIIRGSVPNAFSGTRYIGRKLDAYGAFTFDVNTPLLPPELKWTADTPTHLGRRAVAEVPYSVSDPSDQRISLSLTPEIAGISLTGNSSVRIDAGQLQQKVYTVTLTAVNEDKQAASISMTFDVSNSAPEVSSVNLPAGILISAPGEEATLDLTGLFTDPDADVLTFGAAPMDVTLVSTDNAASGTLSIKGLRFGVGEIVLSASDSQYNTSVNIPVAVVNPANPVYLFPTVATSVVKVAVDSEATQEIQIDVFSYTGEHVYTLSASANAFNPAELPVNKLPPGSYTAKVTFGGTTRSLKFSKK